MSAISNNFVYTEQSFAKSHEVNTSGLTKIINKIVGLVKDICFALPTIISRMSQKKFYSDPKTTPIQDIEGSKGLIVMVHGLNAHPSQFDRMHKALLENEETKNETIYRPHVPNKGNCSLNSAAEKTLQRIRAWALKNPHSPIKLIGVSNGGRIVAHIAHQLKVEDEVLNPIRVSCIAAPLFGTEVIGNAGDQSLKSRFWRFLLKTPLAGSMKPIVIKEMAYGSERAKRLVSQMREGARAGVVFNTYGSTSDSKVTPAPTTAPLNVQNLSSKFYTNEGHSSIIKRAQSDIIDATKEHMKERYVSRVCAVSNSIFGLARSIGDYFFPSRVAV